MPAEIKTDWEAIRAAYVKGLSCQQIADSTGVSFEAIRKRMQRGNWNDLRKAAESMVVANVSHEVAKELESAAEKHIQRVLRVNSKLLERVEDNAETARDTEEIETTAKTLNTLDVIGRRGLGLDRENSTPQIGIYTPVVELRITKPEQTEKPAQVLDVQ